MKRDLNIIRDLLLFYESDGVTEYPTAGADLVGDHIVLLHQHGFIEGERTDGPAMIFPADGRTVTCVNGEVRYLFPITWAGHDFLAAARDQKTWNKAMAAVGGLSIATVKAYLQKLAHEKLGLSVDL